MNKFFLLTFIQLSLCFESIGQKDWESKYNGFVVTEDSSIMKGFLRFEVGSVDRGKKIKLSKKPNDSPLIFYALDLRGYVFKKDTFIIVHNLQPFDDDTRTISKAEALVVQSGKLKLLKVEEVYLSQMWGLNPAQLGLQNTLAITKEHTKIIRDSNGNMISIRRKNFKDNMKTLLKDAPDLLNQIENNTLGYSELERIIESYNYRFR